MQVRIIMERREGVSNIREEKEKGAQTKKMLIPRELPEVL